MNTEQPLHAAEVYERYLSRPIADRWTRVLLELAAPEQGDRVLDLACGTGSVARQVVPMVGVTGQVVAVDINTDMLKVGRTQPQPSGSTIKWVQGDATRLSLPDEDFDLSTRTAVFSGTSGFSA
ncbi:MAG: class I SAM-dependent methyltransferase [Pigmentiphaga sp.]